MRERQSSVVGENKVGKGKIIYEKKKRVMRYIRTADTTKNNINWHKEIQEEHPRNENKRPQKKSCSAPSTQYTVSGRNNKRVPLLPLTSPILSIYLHNCILDYIYPSLKSLLVSVNKCFHTILSTSYYSKNLRD